jgi:hypothetical protein
MINQPLTAVAITDTTISPSGEALSLPRKASRLHPSRTASVSALSTFQKLQWPKKVSISHERLHEER